jgi:hypothetical protein
MPTNETDLINSALALIGHDPIQSLALQNNTVADQCRRLYPLAREQCLRAADWNCATWRQRIDLENSSYTLASLEWNFAYHLPADPYCLKARRLSGTPYDTVTRHHPEAISFRVEGRTLLTNEETPILIYTRDLTPENFDSSLTSAVSLLLASYLAIGVRKDYTQSDKFLQKYQVMLIEASGANQAEGGLDTYISTDLKDVR